MGRNATRKLVADWVGLAAGLVTSLVTARVLGPDGRGVFATVGFVAGFAGSVAVMGLGESLIIGIGQARTTVRHGLASILSAVAVLSVVFAAATWLVAFLLVDGSDAVAIASLASVMVPIGAFTTVLSYGHNARHEFGIPILATVVVAVATALAIAAVLLATDLGLPGAFLALVVGSGIGLGMLIVSSKRRDLLHWSVDLRLLRELLPNGVRLAASGTVSSLTARLDLLLVFLLASEAAAGQYSIALTVSGLAGSAAAAITYATFPQLAYSDQERWGALSDRVVQATLATSAVGAGCLAAGAPILIPLLFGTEFSAAVGPTLILLAGAILASLQWALGRITSARGHPEIALRAYTASLVVMCGADVLLIPRLGIEGAAFAVVLSALAGVLVTSRRMRALGGGLADVSIRPRLSSFLQLPAMVRQALFTAGS